MPDEGPHETEREKLLLVYISPNLYLEANINTISSAHYARLAIIRTSFRNLCKVSIRTLYIAYIRTVLEHVALAVVSYLAQDEAGEYLWENLVCCLFELTVLRVI